MSVHAAKLNAMEWTNVHTGVDRKGFPGEGATVAVNRLVPGHELRPHARLAKQILYIIEGEVDFHIGEETVRLGLGGLADILPNVT